MHVMRTNMGWRTLKDKHPAVRGKYPMAKQSPREE
jgi:hypothetical protein